MPTLTYIHASEAARTTAGGRMLAACGGGAADAMQKVCETIGLFNAEGQCKPSAERSLLQLCRGAACPRPTGQYLPSARLLPLGHRCEHHCARFLRSVGAQASKLGVPAALATATI